MKVPNVRSTATGLRRWLRPGVGVKRWLLLVFLGELGLALAGALWLRQVYRDFSIGGPGQTVVSAVTLQFLPYGVRALIVGTAGVALFAFGAWKVIRAMVTPFVPAEGDQPLVEVIYQKRFLARGPRTVAVGGGTGLSTLLRGLKEHSSNITAVVTVADDGGSSGRLRETLGIPAVGDIRNCIVALADAEPLMGDLLQYRFPSDDSDASLSGHTIGNLLLAAMAAVQGGDFEEGVRQMNRVLAVRGQVVPATASPVTLHAALVDGSEVVGQSAIARHSGIDRVWLTPEGVPPSDDAMKAIAEADLIVMGPGSLYTSILPSLLLPQLTGAIKASTAVRIYVSNVATQSGETQGYDLGDHLAALERHTGPDLVDVVLANNQFSAKRPGTYTAEPVRLRWPPERSWATGNTPRLVLEDVVDPENAHRHERGKLSAAIMKIYERESLARRRSRTSIRSA
jgi:uncharacterized cofD-like protein